MDKDVIEYVPKGDMVYPLSQHIGAPAKAVVKKGDRVLVGQLIAEAGGFVSANIHSSVSGTVKAVEPRLTASGSKVNSIVIENDNQFEEIEYVKMTNRLRSLTGGNPRSNQERRRCRHGWRRIPDECQALTEECRRD